MPCARAGQQCISLIAKLPCITIVPMPPCSKASRSQDSMSGCSWARTPCKMPTRRSKTCWTGHTAMPRPCCCATERRWTRSYTGCALKSRGMCLRWARLSRGTPCWAAKCRRLCSAWPIPVILNTGKGTWQPLSEAIGSDQIWVCCRDKLCFHAGNSLEHIKMLPTCCTVRPQRGAMPYFEFFSQAPVWATNFAG